MECFFYIKHCVKLAIPAVPLILILCEEEPVSSASCKDPYAAKP